MLSFSLKPTTTNPNLASQTLVSVLSPPGKVCGLIYFWEKERKSHFTQLI